MVIAKKFGRRFALKYPPSMANIKRALQPGFNETFAGRELLIRLANEAWFRLFRTNGLASNTDGSIVVSRRRFLIQRHYLVEYAFQRPERNDLSCRWLGHRNDKGRMQTPRRCFRAPNHA